MVGKRLSYYRPALPEFVSLYVVTSKMLCIRGYLFRGTVPVQPLPWVNPYPSFGAVGGDSGGSQ